jgi:hypothetical protein
MDLTIIFCGGGAKFFESKIKGHIFASPKFGADRSESDFEI